MKLQGRSKVTNGKTLFLEGVDGRLPLARRYRDILAEVISDLGGDAGLSEGQRQMARRVAMLSVQAELMEAAAVLGKEFDIDRYGRMTDQLGRALQRLGLRRVAKDITPKLGDYIAGVAEGKAQP